MQLSPRRLGQGGYSLVELLAAAALSAVALASFTAFNRFQLFALRNQATQLDLQTTTRSVVDLMSREVRRAGMDPNCVKTFDGVNIASATRLCIQSDTTAPFGSIQAGTTEHIDYQINMSTGEVERRQGGSGYTWEPVLSGIDMSATRFLYFDANGTELDPGSSGELTSAQRDAVRTVRIDLAIVDESFDPQNSKDVRAQVSTDVDLRNRFFINSTACP